MFTGIIEAKGIVDKLEIKDSFGKLIIHLNTPLKTSPILGDSIAINGTCLTVSSIDNTKISFDVLSETFDRTSLGNLKTNSSVNIESALAFGDKLGGHIVTGHIDGVGIVESIEKVDRDWKFIFSFPKEISDLLVIKGSIAIDGTSLTIADLSNEDLTIYIIPHTYEHTIFNTYHNGSKVNLEVDLLGKYVKRILQHGEYKSYEK